MVLVQRAKVFRPGTASNAARLLRSLLLGLAVITLAGCGRGVGTQAPAPAPPPTSGPGDNGAAGPELEQARERLDQLVEGTLVFNVPDRLRLGEPVRVQVRMARGDVEEMYQDFEDDGDLQRRGIEVSDLMRVRLLADERAFTLLGLSTEDQPVLEQSFTEWSWRVTPERSGPQELYIQVSLWLQLPGRGDTLLDHPVHTERVQVDVNPVYMVRRFATSNWQWLWTVLVVPVGAWILQHRRRRGAATTGTGNHQEDT